MQRDSHAISLGISGGAGAANEKACFHMHLLSKPFHTAAWAVSPCKELKIVPCFMACNAYVIACDAYTMSSLICGNSVLLASYWPFTDVGDGKSGYILPERQSFRTEYLFCWEDMV